MRRFKCWFISTVFLIPLFWGTTAVAQTDIPSYGENQSKNDVIIDFGDGNGLWARLNNSGWVSQHSLSPKSMVTGDLDGNGQDEVIVDFGASYGIWIWMNNSSWVRLHYLSADSMVTGDLDGNGQDEVIVDFGDTYALWIWMNNSSWVQLHELSADSMVTGDLDGNGHDEVIVDFGDTYALWVWMNNSSWVQLHDVSADSMVTGDLDGNGHDEVIVDFGDTYALWIWMNNSTWVQLHDVSADSMVTGNIDGDGQSGIVPEPLYSDAGGIPVLDGDWYGAMGEHPVAKMTINNPKYGDKIANKLLDWYPGDTNAYFKSEDPKVRLTVDMYYPADMHTPRPTIFFISGWRHYHSEQFYSLLYFIASQGYNAVFVSYEETDADQNGFIKSILQTVVADPRFSDKIDTSKVGFMGHSMGAGILFHLAQGLEDWGTEGRFLFPMAGATAYFQTQQLIELPANTKMIVQTYNERENDRDINWDTDPRFSIDYLINTNISDTDKTYLYLPGDTQHISSHDTPKSRYDNGNFYYDALQQVGIFRPLESLMRYTFDNDTDWKHIGLPDSDPDMRETNGIQFYSGDNPYVDLDIADDPSGGYKFGFNDAEYNPDRQDYCCQP